MPCMATTLPPPVQESSETSGAIEAHVQRVLHSPHFARAETQRKLLQYLWEHRFESVSEYAIATEALGRHSNFDSTTDASVRVHISRLRRKLKDYYQQETDEPELLVIPTGTHQLMVLDHPAPAVVAPLPEPAPEPLAVPEVKRSAVPFLCGAIVLLVMAVVWLAWSNHVLRATNDRRAPNAFWASFLEGSAPIRIILPTPILFSFPNAPTFRFRSTMVNDYSDIPKDPQFEALTKDLGKPSLEQPYTVSWDTLAAIDMARYLDSVGAKQRVSFDVTRDLSPMVLEQANVITLGTHQTLQPLHDYLQAMNFTLSQSERRVTNAHPAKGEQATYEIIHKSRDREVRPSIISILPGRAPGLKVLLMQSGDTGALVALISSSAGSNSIEEMWRKNGSPKYFEMVTYTEVENNRALRTWPVAMHVFTAQAPANSM